MTDWLAGSPSSTSERLTLAIDLARIGRTDTAIEVVRGVLAAEPNHVRGLCTLAFCLDEVDDHAETLAAAQAAIAADPDEEWAYRLQSLALRKLHRIPEALAAADRAVELDPHRSSAHLVRCKALLASGQTLEAYRAAIRVRELAPLDVSTFYLFTDVWEAAGELGVARREYLAGLAVSPTYDAFHGGLAYLDRLHRRNASAARRYLGVLAGRPADSWYRTRLYQTVAALQRQLGLFGTLLMIPVLATYQPFAARPSHLVTSAVVLVVYLAVIARAHRRLGRLWTVRKQIRDGAPTSLGPPQLAMILPIVLMLSMGLLSRWVPPGVTVPMFLAMVLAQWHGWRTLIKDIQAAVKRARQREAFRAGLRQAGLTRQDPPSAEPAA